MADLGCSSYSGSRNDVAVDTNNPQSHRGQCVQRRAAYDCTELRGAPGASKRNGNRDHVTHRTSELVPLSVIIEITHTHVKSRKGQRANAPCAIA